jgi:hypothetical protein
LADFSGPSIAPAGPNDKSLVRRAGRVVNNAGVYQFEPIEAVTEKEFHRQFVDGKLPRGVQAPV